MAERADSFGINNHEVSSIDDNIVHYRLQDANDKLQSELSENREMIEVTLENNYEVNRKRLLKEYVQGCTIRGPHRDYSSWRGAEFTFRLKFNRCTF